MGRSQGLLRKKDAAGALEMARQAERLAPGNAEVTEMVGQALEANGQREETLGAYRKALEIAKRVQPEWQARRIKGLEKRLGGGRP